MGDPFLSKQVYQLPEGEHRYGKRVHLLSDLYLQSLLAELCLERTKQPLVNELVSRLYNGLLTYAMNSCFPTTLITVPTRMASYHPKEAVFCGPVFDRSTRVVSVNLARAGTLPSHVCYSLLTYLLDPEQVRQDHVSIARTTNFKEQVTGSEVSGHKIGGKVDGAILLFPDPMGATGATIDRAIDLYQSYGTPRRVLALHLIVTPEYIRRVTENHPEIEVFAIRLDRGLSSQKVLDSVPGTYWAEEKGLNEKSYIVPGAGGLGEILNNAFV